MDLVPVYEEAGEETPGTIKISPTTVQSMGVRTAKVEVRPLSRLTLAVGLVTFNERNLAVLNTKVDGWVDRLYVNATGDPVRRGQTLLSIYSPELVSAQEEYLLAVRNLKAMQNSPVKEMADGARRLADAARRRLAYFDISAAQINALERTGQVKKHLALTSPATGIVTKRMVTQGMFVKAGMPAPRGRRPVHRLGGRRHLPVRTALDQGGPTGHHDPGLPARRDLPGQDRLSLPLPQGSHPHRHSAPALFQPRAQTQARDVRPGQDRVPGGPQCRGRARRRGDPTPASSRTSSSPWEAAASSPGRLSWGSWAMTVCGRCSPALKAVKTW